MMYLMGMMTLFSAIICSVLCIALQLMFDND
jgi:hypothetical protein